MPIVVESDHGDQPCAEMWVDPDVLATTFPDFDTESLTQAALDATWLLWTLTGERFHGPQAWVEDYEISQGDSSRLELRQFPVARVYDVSSIDLCDISQTGIPTTGYDSADSVSSWCYLGHNTLRLGVTTDTNLGFTGAGCHVDAAVRVRYTTENNLAPGTRRAALKLASEFARMMNGKPCQLPERIQTVNRQGVSWTILDPQDFLDRQRTGIGSVDQWLAAANGTGWTKVRDPLSWHKLVYSTIVGCGADAGEAFL